MSRSTYMLMALAPPAASVPPSTVQTISHSGGMPCSATTIVGTVVTSSSSMIRGFVSATYAADAGREARARRADTTGEARSGSGPAGEPGRPRLERWCPTSVAWAACPASALD